MIRVAQFLALLTLTVAMLAFGTATDMRDINVSKLKQLDFKTDESEVYRGQILKLLSKEVINDTMDFMSASSYEQIIEGITGTPPNAAQIGIISDNIKTLATIHKYLYNEVDITKVTDARSSEELKAAIDTYIADSTNNPTPAEISATMASLYASKIINTKINQSLENRFYIITDINDVKKGLSYNIYPIFKQIYNWKSGETFDKKYPIEDNKFDLANGSLNKTSSTPIKEYFYEYPLDTEPQDSEIFKKVLSTKNEDILYTVTSTKQHGVDMYYNIGITFNRDSNETIVYTKMFADDEFIEDFKSNPTLDTTDAKNVVKISAVAVNDINQEIPVVYVAYLLKKDGKLVTTIKEFSIIDPNGTTLVENKSLDGDNSDDTVTEGDIIFDKHKKSPAGFTFKNINIKDIELVGDYNKFLEMPELALVVDSDVNYIDETGALDILRTDRVVYTYEYYPQISDKYYFSYVTQQLSIKEVIKPKIKYLESMSLNMFIMATYKKDTGDIKFYEYMPLIDTKMESTILTPKSIPNLIDFNFDIRSSETVNLGIMDLYTLERTSPTKNTLYYTEGAYEIDDVAIDADDEAVTAGNTPKIRVVELDPVYNNMLVTSSVGNLEASHLIVNNKLDNVYAITDNFSSYLETLNYDKEDSDIGILTGVLYDTVVLSNGEVLFREFSSNSNYRSKLPDFDYYLKLDLLP